MKDKSVIDKLRWSTLGYHHDWDTKVTRKSLNIKLQLIIFSNIVKKTRENFHQSLDNYVNISPQYWATPIIHQRLPLSTTIPCQPHCQVCHRSQDERRRVTFVYFDLTIQSCVKGSIKESLDVPIHQPSWLVFYEVSDPWHITPGHTDHSEHNLSAPLFSISLGLPAIFLIGGLTLDTVPSALLLR